MTAFVKTGTKPIIGFFDKQVDANLTRFATGLVDAYLPLPWAYTGCGDACGSDHMSFNKAGFPVAFATEGLFEGAPLPPVRARKADGCDRWAAEYTHCGRRHG